MSYNVYKHTFPNGKVYIGITSQKPEDRWNDGRGYRTQRLIGRAIQKYGWENVQHDILFDGLTKEEAEQKEIELISYYKSNNKHYGYNIENGGNSVGKLSEETKRRLSKAQKGKRHLHSEETKRKISESHKGKHHSEETKQKISKLNKGKYDGYNNPFYGKYHSEETKKKMKENHADYSGKNHPLYGKHHSEETKQKIIESLGKKVLCIETNKIYDSMGQASKLTGIDSTSIGRCCNGKQKTAGGYHWELTGKDIKTEN